MVKFSPQILASEEKATITTTAKGVHENASIKQADSLAETVLFWHVKAQLSIK